MTDTEQSLARLWTYSREIGSAIWGDDVKRDNGLRSRVIVLESTVDDEAERRMANEARISHYLDKEREETCIGKMMLAIHEEEHDDMVRMANDMKKKRWETMATLGTSLLTMAGVVFVAIQQSQTAITVAQIMAQGVKP